MIHGRVKRWSAKQSYRTDGNRKDTKYPWIKLWKSYPTDFHVRQLAKTERLTLIYLFLLADQQTGIIEMSQDEFRHITDLPRVNTDKYTHFIEWLPSGCQVDATRKPQGRTEKSRVDIDKKKSESRETAAELRASLFSEFWDLYPETCPRKVQIVDCETKFTDLMKAGIDSELIFSALVKASACRQWQEDGGQYIPSPLVFLNQSRWLDDYGGGDVSEGGSNLEGIGL